MISLLPPTLPIPGRLSPTRHHWLFPILTQHASQRETCMAQLNRYGVDAYRGATQLALVERPPEKIEPEIRETVSERGMMQQCSC